MHQDQSGPQDLQDPPEEVWFTPGGVVAPVLVCQGLSWCTQEEQGDLLMFTLGMELTTSACPTIHSTPYSPVLEFRMKDVYMEQNIRLHWKGQMSMMFPVLCV